MASRINNRNKNLGQSSPKSDPSKGVQAVSDRPIAPKNLGEEVQTLPQGKVKMKFKENKFFNDLDNPMFLAGVEYELEGADWIQRWLRRGGEITSGALNFPTPEVNPSEIVDNSPPPGETGPEPRGRAVGMFNDEKDNE